MVKYVTLVSCSSWLLISQNQFSGCKTFITVMEIITKIGRVNSNSSHGNYADDSPVSNTSVPVHRIKYLSANDHWYITLFCWSLEIFLLGFLFQPHWILYSTYGTKTRAGMKANCEIGESSCQKILWKSDVTSLCIDTEKCWSELISNHTVCQLAEWPLEQKTPLQIVSGWHKTMTTEIRKE